MRQEYNALSSFGCVACRSNDGFWEALADRPPANIHHIQGGKRKWWYVIPLCPDHHQHGEEAIHRNKKKFRAVYGDERELFIKVRNVMTVAGLWPEKIETEYQRGL